MTSAFRRAYVYVIIAISLVVVAIALVNVLDFGIAYLWERVSGDDLIEEPATEIRRQLSLFLALIGVALPVLGLHGYLAERWARDEADRRSVLRALYFTAALAISLQAFATTLGEFLESALRSLFGFQIIFTPRDGIVAVLVVLVSGAIWLLHGWLRHRDSTLTELPQRANWPLRAYLYATLFISAVIGLSGIAELLATLAELFTEPGQQFASAHGVDRSLPGAVSRTVVGALIWSVHWAYSRALLRDTGWRGAAERASTLRRVYLFGLLLVSVAVTIVASSFAIGEILTAISGTEAEPVSREVLRNVLDPLMVALAFGMAWWLQRGSTLAEAETHDTPDTLISAARLNRYIVSLVGLVVGAIGLGYLAGVTVEFMFDAVGMEHTDTIWDSEEASVFVAMLILGGGIWARTWISIQRIVQDSPDEERSTTSRRAYFYLAIGFSTLALFAALATLLYQLFQILLGVDELTGLAGMIAMLLGVSLVALLSLINHLRLLLGDLRFAEPAPGPSTTMATMHLTFAGRDQDALRALAEQIKRDLPESVQITEVTMREPDNEPGQKHADRESPETETDQPH